MSEPTLKRKLESAETDDTKKAKQEESKAASSEKVDGKTPENESSDDATVSQVTNGQSQASDVTETAKSPEQKKPTEEISKDASVSPKPVFGAASTFGKASIFDKMKSNANVFDNASEKGNAATTSFGSSFGSSFGLFGASSKFANALQRATEKKSFLDEPDDKSESKSPSQTPQTTQQYKQVELVAQEVKTGEENEQSLYNATAKLFELDLTKMADGWKERGLGPLHLNQSLDDPAQVRLVMRSQGLLRVILNYRITSSTVLIKGLEASLSPGKYLRFNTVSPEGKPVQYLLKFANESLRDTLVDKVAEVKTASAEHDRTATQDVTDEDSEGEN